MDVFRKYFRDNAEPFIGYPPKRDMESAEHTLEHWDLFQTYLKLYEDTLNEWLEREGVENAQFYKDVQHVQDTTTDPKVQEFVYCLLASCDYDSFYSVMVREAMKLGASSKPILRAPDTAEAKNADDGDAGAKGDKGSK